jgi:hypothetical protein
MKNKIAFPALLLSSSILLVACGGDSSSTSAAAEESRTVVGTVDGFGSVIVNGVHYQSTDTEFEINDRSGIESQLRVGQLVVVEGRDDGSEGVALRISYDADIRGPVTSVDTATNTMVILGQSISMDAMTVFSGVDLDTITVGQYLEVSGLRDSNGNVLASYISLEDSTEIELRGTITNLDDVAMTYTIGSMVVDYSRVATLDLEDATLSNDMLVEVEGSLDSNVLVANKVEQEDMHRGHDGEIRVFGYISAYDAVAGTMTIGGTDILLTSSTEYEDGTQTELKLNAMVKVQGSFNEDGQLVAAEVEFASEVKLELEGPVTAVGDGTLTVMGVTAMVDTRTRVRDERDDEYYFNLDSVAVGDYVELRLMVEADGSYRALRLEREDSDSHVKVTAPIDSIDVLLGTVTMLGITVDLSAMSALDLATLITGGYLEVKGTFDGSVIVATEAGEDDRYKDHDDHEEDDSEENDESEIDD